MESQVKVKKKRVAVTVPPAAPDGGYSWLILISSFFVFGLTFGVIKSFGVFFTKIHQHFQTTATGASWITSIMVATIYIVAPLASVLSACFSHRAVVIIGGLICSLGVIAGSFSDNLIELCVTVGFLNGVGYALSWIPTVTILSFYFEKKRPLANALSTTGECIFTFVLTPLFQVLINAYTWRGALLCLGGLQLLLCVCGVLLRPLRASKNEAFVSEVTTEEQGFVQQTLLLEPSEPKPPLGQESAVIQTCEAPDVGNVTVQLEEPEEQSLKESRCTPKTSEFMAKVLRYMDYSLITNANFMVFTMFGVFSCLGLFAPVLFLVPYARSKGVQEHHAALLVSISAALDLLGRIVFGWVANLRLIQAVKQLTATVLLQGILLLLFPLASSYIELVALSAAYGLTFGATVSIHITVLSEVVGVHRLGSALGFFMLIRSGGGLLGPPIAGLLIDRTGDYGTAFLMAGVAFIISTMFLLALHCMNTRGQKPTLNVSLNQTEQNP